MNEEMDLSLKGAEKMLNISESNTKTTTKTVFNIDPERDDTVCQNILTKVNTDININERACEVECSGYNACCTDNNLDCTTIDTADTKAKLNKNLDLLQFNVPELIKNLKVLNDTIEIKRHNTNAQGITATHAKIKNDSYLHKQEELEVLNTETELFVSGLDHLNSTTDKVEGVISVKEEYESLCLVSCGRNSLEDKSGKGNDCSNEEVCSEHLCIPEINNIFSEAVTEVVHPKQTEDEMENKTLNNFRKDNIPNDQEEEDQKDVAMDKKYLQPRMSVNAVGNRADFTVGCVESAVHDSIDPIPQHIKIEKSKFDFCNEGKENDQGECISKNISFAEDEDENDESLKFTSEDKVEFVHFKNKDDSVLCLRDSNDEKMENKNIIRVDKLAECNKEESHINSDYDHGVNHDHIFSQNNQNSPSQETIKQNNNNDTTRYEYEAVLKQNANNDVEKTNDEIKVGEIKMPKLKCSVTLTKVNYEKDIDAHKQNNKAGKEVNQCIENTSEQDITDDKKIEKTYSQDKFKSLPCNCKVEECKNIGSRNTSISFQLNDNENEATLSRHKTKTLSNDHDGITCQVNGVDALQGTDKMIEKENYSINGKVDNFEVISPQFSNASQVFYCDSYEDRENGIADRKTKRQISNHNKNTPQQNNDAAQSQFQDKETIHEDREQIRQNDDNYKGHFKVKDSPLSQDKNDTILENCEDKASQINDSETVQQKEDRFREENVNVASKSKDEAISFKTNDKDDARKPYLIDNSNTNDTNRPVYVVKDEVSHQTAEQEKVIIRKTDVHKTTNRLISTKEKQKKKPNVENTKTKLTRKNHHPILDCRKDEMSPAYDDESNVCKNKTIAIEIRNAKCVKTFDEKDFTSKNFHNTNTQDSEETDLKEIVSRTKYGDKITIQLERSFSNESESENNDICAQRYLSNEPNCVLYQSSKANIENEQRHLAIQNEKTPSSVKNINPKLTEQTIRKESVIENTAPKQLDDEYDINADSEENIWTSVFNCGNRRQNKQLAVDVCVGDRMKKIERFNRDKTFIGIYWLECLNIRERIIIVNAATFDASQDIFINLPPEIEPEDVGDIPANLPSPDLTFDVAILNFQGQRDMQNVHDEPRVNIPVQEELGEEPPHVLHEEGAAIQVTENPTSEENSKKSSCTGFTPPDEKEVRIRALHRENTHLREKLVCKICEDKPVMITFLPCRHLVCCQTCATMVTACPLCQKQVDDKVRTYTS